MNDTAAEALGVNGKVLLQGKVPNPGTPSPWRKPSAYRLANQGGRGETGFGGRGAP